MRYNLRLHGKTKDGKACQADITVYASSSSELQEEAVKESANAAWHYSDPPLADVPEGSEITVEKVEALK
jgi:hypothetical protein